MLLLLRKLHSWEARSCTLVDFSLNPSHNAWNILYDLFENGKKVLNKSDLKAHLITHIHRLTVFKLSQQTDKTVSERTTLRFGKAINVSFTQQMVWLVINAQKKRQARPANRMQSSGKLHNTGTISARPAAERQDSAAGSWKWHKSSSRSWHFSFDTSLLTAAD